nr:RNA polymerase sigma factor SigM [Rhodococcus sp. HNM0569]
MRGEDGDGPSDIELLDAHVAGDPHAFAALFDRHRHHLWHVALRTCRNEEDAADGLQEALLSAHRSAGSFRRDAAVRSWLHAIVVNSCLDRIRRNRTRPSSPLGDDEYTIPAPRDEMSSAELRLELTRALALLPDEQRAAVVAIDVEGYSVSAAADKLGIAQGTVKSRCARGRRKLADALGYLRDEGNRS